MILVNNKATYGSVARELIADKDCWAELERITTGDWPPLSLKHLNAFGDFLAGSDAGVITVIYRILDFKLVSVPRQNRKPGDPAQLVDKMRFTVEPAPEMTWLIGIDQPGGPWRKGEARGTRRIDTPVRRSTSTLREWRRAVRAAARRTRPTGSWASMPVLDPTTGIEVSRRDDGALLIAIPAEIARTVLAGGLLQTTASA